MPTGSITNKIGYHIDYDGCGAEERNLIKVIVLFKEDLLKYPHAQFYFFVFSYRQSISCDIAVWERNKNGSAFIEIKRFVDRLRKQFPGHEHQIHLEKFLLEDTQWNEPVGTAFDYALSCESGYSKTSSPPSNYHTTRHTPPWHDEEKRSLTYQQITHLTHHCLPHGEIGLSRFFDDKSSILDALMLHYDNKMGYSYFLPKNHELHLYHLELGRMTTHGLMIGDGVIDYCKPFSHKNPQLKSTGTDNPIFNISAQFLTEKLKAYINSLPEIDFKLISLVNIKGIYILFTRLADDFMITNGVHALFKVLDIALKTADYNSRIEKSFLELGIKYSQDDFVYRVLKKYPLSWQMNIHEMTAWEYACQQNADKMYTVFYPYINDFSTAFDGALKSKRIQPINMLFEIIGSKKTRFLLRDFKSLYCFFGDRNLTELQKKLLDNFIIKRSNVLEECHSILTLHQLLRDQQCQFDDTLLLSLKNNIKIGVHRLNIPIDIDLLFAKFALVPTKEVVCHLLVLFFSMLHHQKELDITAFVLYEGIVHTLRSIDHLYNLGFSFIEPGMITKQFMNVFSICYQYRQMYDDVFLEKIQSNDFESLAWFKQYLNSANIKINPGQGNRVIQFNGIYYDDPASEFHNLFVAEEYQLVIKHHDQSIDIENTLDRKLIFHILLLGLFFRDDRTALIDDWLNFQIKPEKKIRDCLLLATPPTPGLFQQRSADHDFIQSLYALLETQKAPAHHESVENNR